MNGIIRYTYKKVLPVRLRRQLDIFSFLRDGVYNPQLVATPEGQNILVLAPHSDDDIIGCGGTLHKHSSAGNFITVAYMTDGRKGGDGLISEDQCVAIRRQEAYQAAKVIGIQEQIFLENRDMELSADSETVATIREIIDKTMPDIVYLPFFMDNHPDHQATNDILIAAVKGKRYQFMCYAYEIWTPFIPNCIVDITPYSDVKVDALKKFVSQTERFNVIGASLGLAKYRAVMHLGKDGYVECFLRCKINEYVRFMNMVI